ncbi:transcriptional repressor DicA [compost metagenome]
MLSTKLIGERITEARKKASISQAQLAEQLFISPQAVGKWERGESMPDIITLNRLAEILGVDLNYFASGTRSESHAAGNTPDNESNATQIPQILPAKPKKPRWDMSRGSWANADFSGLKELHEKFSSSHLQNCRFIGSDLSGLLLSDNYVNGCDFSESDLSKSNLKGSHLAKNVFTDCSLREAEISGSHISNSDFTDADFTGTTFASGGFEKNTVSNATWNQTAFRKMYLADIVFEGILEDCTFEACAFKRVTFQNATLSNVFFKNKSLKQLKFIECQADRLTYEFLKNGKADLSGIKLVML